jgi:hypothetical protein
VSLWLPLVQFPVQLEPFSSTQRILKKCSLQAEEWTSVRPWFEATQGSWAGIQSGCCWQGAYTRPLFSGTLSLFEAHIGWWQSVSMDFK